MLTWLYKLFGLHIHEWGQYYRSGRCNGWIVQSRECKTCGMIQHYFP